MGLQVRKAKMRLTFREEKPEVFKLCQLTYPQVTFAELVQECSDSCGVNTSQTKAVVDALLGRLVHYMRLGHGVSLGEFGSFKPVVNSKTARSLKETTLDTIRVKKVRFYPGGKFQQMAAGLNVAEAEDLSEKEPEGEGGGEG